MSRNTFFARLRMLNFVAILVAGASLAAWSTSASADGYAPTRQVPEPAQPVRELPELRTENSDTYLLSDGSHAQKIYSHPVNFRTGDAGPWQPIEDQLVQAEDGSWQPQASPVPISFPSSLGAGSVSVGSGEHQLSFQLQGAASSEGAPAGALRTYPNALPDTNAPTPPPRRASARA